MSTYAASVLLVTVFLLTSRMYVYDSHSSFSGQKPLGSVEKKGSLDPRDLLSLHPRNSNLKYDPESKSSKITFDVCKKSGVLCF